jgi:hypothetical protein
MPMRRLAKIAEQRKAGGVEILAHGESLVIVK